MDQREKIPGRAREIKIKKKKSRVSPYGIWKGFSFLLFSVNTSVFPCQFHSTAVQLLGKIKN
jgi:hypothetical protein